MNKLPKPGDKYQTKASIPAAYILQGTTPSQTNLNEMFIHRDVELEVVKTDIENYTKVKTLEIELLRGTNINVFYIADKVLLDPLNKAFFAEATLG